jgi:phosphoglycolate phosphatase
MPQPRNCRFFLFDLDGTLVDSRADIIRAVDAALAGMGLPSPSPSDVIRFVGDGIEPLIQRVLLQVTGCEPGREQVGEGIKRMVAEYRSHLIVSTDLYPGVRETLSSMDWASLGLISNKQEEFCKSILSHFGLADRFCAVLGGDSLARRKPDPAPLLEAMSRCNLGPTETVMVGDSPADILAGKAAGTATCGVSYGFRSREELLAAGADLVIDRFGELLQHFPKPWKFTS